MGSRPLDSKRPLASLALLALAAAAGSVAADDSDPLFTRSESFVGAHPDLDWRTRGVTNYNRGHYREAMIDFRRAARFADKTSQALIAQMLWNGDGVKADRATAYVWADLAAERGYPSFVATRERFRRELSEDERHAAAAVSQAIFEEYGDAVAKQREASALLRVRLNVTGSRTGRVSGLSLEQQLYYADEYWKPEQYWQWLDRVWTEPPKGTVEVGPIETPPEN